MTKVYELTKMFKRREMIVVCMVSAEQYKKGLREDLEFRIGDEWFVTKPKIKNYQNYSHGICLSCLKQYFPKTYEKYLIKM